MKTLGEISSSRINSITFLRLIASLAVIYGHAYAVVSSGGQDLVTQITGYAHAGGVAVDFFFLLSGFLVTGSLLRQGVIGYFLARAVRLFPALWAHLLIMGLGIGLIITTVPALNYLSDGQTWKYIYLIGSGLEAQWFLPGVFGGNRNAAVNGSIWSVVLEIRMYLYLGLFYMCGGLRNRHVFNAAVFVLVVLVWAGLLKVPGLTSATDLHVASLFLLGCVLYINRELIVVTPITVILVIGLAAITHGTDRFQYAYTLLLVCVFCVVSFIQFGAWMDRFGDYSYGVYLWGWPVQQMVVMAWPNATAIENALISSVISLCFAFFSWHFIEKRALALKSKVSQFYKVRLVDCVGEAKSG